MSKQRAARTGGVLGGRKRGRPAGWKAACEALEPRRLLAVQTWSSTGIPDANWTTTGNFLPGPLAPGDTLVFNGSDTSPTSNNDDLNDDAYSLKFDANGYDLTGGGITLSDGGGTAILADNSGGGNTIDLPLTVSGAATASVTNAPAFLTFDNSSLAGLAGSTLTTTGPGLARFTSNFDGSGFQGSFIDQGPLEVDGKLGAASFQLDGGRLSGSGTVGSIIATPNAGGSVAPAGAFNVGSVTLDPSSGFVATLNGPNAGQFTQINASGAVNLNDASLSVALNYTPSATDSWVILDNTSNATATGTFANLPQGGTITVDGRTLQINYAAGASRNEVTLSVFNPPVAAPDFFTTPEDTTLFVPSPGVLANDTDPQGLALHPIVTTLPTHGTLTLNGDGSFTYAPATGYSGPDSFSYEAGDGVLTSAPVAVSLVVNPVNLPPQVQGVTFSGLDDATLSIAAPGVLASAVSPEGLALAASVVSGPSHGVLALNANGSFSYTPTTGFVGQDSFTFLATDTNGLTSTPATATLNIGAADVAATLHDSSFGATENGSIFVAGPGVLANADRPGGNTLSAFLLSTVTHGSLSLNSDGSFTYTPANNYSGTDRFTYQATDGRLTTNVATVTLTVQSVPVAPTAGDDAYSVLEGQALTVSAPGLLLNDTYPGGAPTVVPVNGPLHGTLSPFASPSDGSFTYTPSAGYYGSDSFSYDLTSDGLTSNLATVSITVVKVNAAPTAADDAYTLDENGSFNIAAPGVLANDADPNGLLLSAVLQANPSHGKLSLNSDGSFAYTPNPNFSGTDTFTYDASDGASVSNVATVTLTVRPVPVAPTAGDDAYSVLEGQALTVSAPGLLLNDTYPGGAPTVVPVNGPLHGTLSPFASPSDGSFTYTPAAGYFGTDSFSYYLSSGGLTSNLATVSITVVKVNTTPTAGDDSYSINENGTLNVAAPGVLANDTDPNGLSLSAVVQSNPSHGTLALNSNGSFAYTPDANFAGIDSFTYLAGDGTVRSNVATVTIAVQSIPVGPTAGNDAYSVLENQALTVSAPGLLLNDTYPGGAPTVVIVNSPLHGALSPNPLPTDGSFVYTPAAGFYGSDSFTYYLRSAGLTSNLATATITVVKVNAPPVAADDSYAVNENATLNIAAPGVLANDVDPNGLALSAIVQADPLHGTLALGSNGSFAYTPAANFSGTDRFTYLANDGALNSGVATVTITVRAVAVAPTAVNDTYSVPENQSLKVPAAGILLNDSYPGGTPTVVVANGPLHGTLSPFASPSDGSFSYTPATNFSGLDSFTYYLNSDGLNSNLATVTIAVAPVSLAPIVGATPLSYTTNENAALTVAAPGALANVVDPNGLPLSAALQTGPSHGTLTLNSDGSFVYTPATNYSGADRFVYLASNGKLYTPATVDLNVTRVTLAPTVAGGSFATSEDETLVVPAPGILGGASDPNGLAITAVLVNPTLDGTLTLNPNGGFTYVPNPNFSGTDSFTFRASNGQLDSNLGTVTIGVAPVPPTTVQLNPASDTGASSTDRITRDTSPTFQGTTGAGLSVVLYAQLTTGAGTPVPVGRATSDAAGNYSITSSALADGTYALSVAAFRGDGLTTGTVYAGSLVIDTVAPVITGAQMVPRTGQVYLTFRDNVSGLDLASLTDASNYSFTRPTSSTPRSYAITGARLVPPVASVGTPVTVVLTVADGRRILHGRYLLAALSGGITDVAGNALDGHYAGTFPTGDGTPGSPFNALFLNNGFKASVAVPTDRFVPVLTKSTVKAQARPPASKPRGPLIHAASHPLKPKGKP